MANLRVDKITSTETFETTGSVQFGNDNALKIAANSDFDLTSNDFTMESWICMNSVESFQTILMYTVDGTEDDTSFQFDITSTQLRFVAYVSNSSKVYGSNFSFESDTWYHVAATRTNDLVRLFVDGDLIGTHNFASTIDTEGSAELNIGYRNNNGTMDREVFGHLTNIRIINGKALYTANFKPPMRELEVVPGTALLACQSKTDASLEKTGKTITANGNAVASELTPGILTPVPKAGAGSAITGSVEFDGTGDYLVPTGSDFGLSSSEDFTLETWIHATSFDNSSTYSEVLRQGTNDASTDGMYFLALSAGTVEWRLSGTTKTSTNKMTAGSWNHIAVCRASGTVYISVNGLTENFGSVTNSSTTSAFRIGANFEATAFFEGHLSNVRFVKGTALYTDSFIPPTRELKKVPGTVLLACQDPDSPLTEATGKTITGYGDLQRADDVELITNGSFAGDFTGWTNGNPSQFTYSTDSIGGDTSGKLKYVAGDSNLRTFTQYVTCVTGQKYNLSFVASSNASNAMVIDIDGTNVVTIDNNSNANLARYNHVFTAGSTSVRIRVESAASNTSYFDNFSVTLAEGSNKGSNFTPQVGDDRKVTFEGVTKINTDAYFYLPTGDTVTRDSRSGRGVNSGGLQPSKTSLMEFVNISSQGNAQDFGNLTINRYGHGSCASSTRGIFAGGWQGSPADYEQSIDSFTIATTGNAIDFGDFATRGYGMAGCGSNTRGIFSGFRSAPSTYTNIIEYVTIASLGSAATFGGLPSPLAVTHYLGALSSPVRGVFAGGRQSPSNYNSIYYVTIASTGNAIDFGDLSTTPNQVVGASSNVRGIFGGGYTPSSYPSTVQYITIASTGNAQDFGDVITATRGGSTMSNSNRALFAGGGTPSNQNIINFFTISTTGDATDFGDLTHAARSISALSDSHGGLG